MEVDRVARAPRFFALAFLLVLTASLRSVSVVCGGFIGVADDGGLLREFGMVDDRRIPVKVLCGTPRDNLVHRRVQRAFQPQKLGVYFQTSRMGQRTNSQKRFPPISKRNSPDTVAGRSV